MEEKLVIHYKKYLTNYLKAFKWVNVAVIGLSIISFFLGLEIGFKIVAVLLILIACLCAYCIAKTRDFELSFDEEEWSYKHHPYKYSDIRSIKQTDRQFIITTDQEIKLDIMNYELEDLNEMLEVLNAHDITVEEVPNESKLNQLFSFKRMRTFSLIIAVIDWIYLILAFRYMKNYLWACAILSFILPLFFVCFYTYRLLRGDLDDLDKMDNNLFMVFYLPVIAGWIVIFTRHAISTFTNAIIVSIIIYAYLIYIYTLIRTLVGSARDSVLTYFMLFFIPLVIFFSSTTLPADHTYHEQATITMTRKMEARLGSGYQINARVKGKKTETYNVSAKLYNKYKKGDKVTIETKVGIFGISSSDIID